MPCRGPDAGVRPRSGRALPKVRAGDTAGVGRAFGPGAAAVRRAHTRADARARESAARLHALSPLAVLGRGYAVCWTGDRTALVRRAADVAPGDRVRVTLGAGEIGCAVRDVIAQESTSRGRA